LQPGAPGCDPHPPAVAFTLRDGAGFFTTVPSWVVPCDVHSQNPPTGMVVAQVSFPAWQILTADAGPPASTEAASTPPAKTPIRRMCTPLFLARPALFRSKHDAPAADKFVRSIISCGAPGDRAPRLEGCNLNMIIEDKATKPARAGFGKGLLFCRKEAKDFYSWAVRAFPAMAGIYPRAPDIKVFWFFSSEKNSPAQ